MIQKTLISVNNEIFQKFPNTKVAVALIEGVVVTSKKGPNYKVLSPYKQEVAKMTNERGITESNVSTRAVCESWDKVFKSTGVEDDKKSTIYNLLKRAAVEGEKIQNKQKANMGNINDIVDMYNCVSIEAETPMGALSKEKIKGDIVLRFGKEGETFKGLGMEEAIKVKEGNVVYADNESILTLHWNYRDAHHACVPNKTENPIQVYVFADQAHVGAGDPAKAIDLLSLD